VVHNEKLSGFFREDEQDIDRVLDIFSRENTGLLDKHWDDIADVLRLTADLLADSGLSAANLSANSVVVPIACYLHHRAFALALAGSVTLPSGPSSHTYTRPSARRRSNSTGRR
jgi:hypothetical protein